MAHCEQNGTGCLVRNVMNPNNSDWPRIASRIAQELTPKRVYIVDSTAWLASVQKTFQDQPEMKSGILLDFYERATKHQHVDFSLALALQESPTLRDKTRALTAEDVGTVCTEWCS